jgi:hypothetical protein
LLRYTKQNVFLVFGELVCDLCRERWSNIPNTNIMELDDTELELLENNAEFQLLADELKPICGACFKQWKGGSATASS